MGECLSEPPRYAEVAVHPRAARVGRVLTYQVPVGQPLQVGQRVWAPLQGRAATGLVVELHRRPPTVAARPLLAVADRMPLVADWQLRLAAWLARRYACSLAAALSGFLPPGTRPVPRLMRAALPNAQDQPGSEVVPLSHAFGRRRYVAFAELVAQIGLPTVADALATGRLVAEDVRARLTPLPLAAIGLPPPPSALDDAQRQAYDAIRAALDARRPRSFLLHGVTGSGKTHVYLHAAHAAVASGRQVLVLVSDIALVPAAEQRFGQWFPGLLAIVHSQQPPAGQQSAWERIAGGGARLVLGARSALFSPFRDLGLIVLDEEHETAYKQQDLAPCYHARELAIELGRATGAPVILGSATPDVCTYHAALRGQHELLELPRRYAPGAAGSLGVVGRVAEPKAPAMPAAAVGDETWRARGRDTAVGGEAVQPTRSDAVAAEAGLPGVQIVDLRAELAAGNSRMFSRVLMSEVARVLDLRQQAILFLNRRGMATCVTCRDCGHTVACAACQLPMIYHADLDLTVCHHCNERRRPPRACPGCGGARIRYLGAGTERVADEVRRAFPNARVLRWDRDTTSTRGAHQRLWTTFERGDADVLVGTQMVAKALDFPRVTLVGVVLADTGLLLPDFRAAERGFQLLTQVAGRAGRGELPGRVIVQTYTPGHYAIQAARLQDYDQFAQRELAFREQHGYPPFQRLARLLYHHEDESRCWRECGRVLRLLRTRLGADDRDDVRLVGPAPAYFRKLRSRYRWQVLITAPAPERLLADLNLPAGWTVDVDPTSLL